MDNIEIQGHRGCRGLQPENTIVGFLHALDLGVHTLEMDVVISKDRHVVVSHDPYFSHTISTKPDGRPVRLLGEKKHNIYELTLEEIQQYDVGLKRHTKFPEQNKVAAYKPSLAQVVHAVQSYCKEHGIAQPEYNIEIKRRASWDNKFTPEFKDFSDLVYHSLSELGIIDQTTLQCFDDAVLNYMQPTYPDLRYILLVENKQGLVNNLNRINFTPYAYSPDYNLIEQSDINYCKEHGIKLIPWTVNNTEDMQSLIEMGIDGIITDYPDKLINLINQRK